MSYLVLARKYRPRTFSEVVGQEVACSVLRGALGEERTGHAYLFCGPRGTGKTTIARILAKALNCEQGPTADPCGTCERCVAADRGNEVDIVEIDAASHTGVDNIRELRDQTAYAPMRARTKVYIIDEVHMLSKGAFNALLKTLEEPPPHVVFLFATTELHRLPDTIVSRCQVLKLAPLSEEQIVARLGEVTAAEGVEPGEGVLEEIARRARGGMRDALSLTDQLLSLVGDRPGLDDLHRLGGESGAAGIEALLARLEERDRAGVLAALPAREGEEAVLLSGVLDHLRQCLLAALCGKDTPGLVGGPAAREQAVARAGRLGPDRLELWLAELLHARERMRILPGQGRLVLEMALLELCREGGDLPLAELESRLAALEGRLGAAGPPSSGAAAGPRPEPTPVRTVRPQPAPRAEAAPAPRAGEPELPLAPSASDPEGAEGAAPGSSGPPEASPGPAPRSLRETWERLLEELAGKHAGLAEMLGRCGQLASLDDRRAVVRLSGTRSADRRIAGSRRNLKACADALSALAGHRLDVSLEDEAETTPADEYTQSVADLFGGRIEEGT